MISDEKKEEIRATADIVEIVGDYVKLKKSGSGFTGLCPFHNEKTPSFHVTPRLGIYKCFGCGESGDVFSFVMSMESISFPESLRVLAERYGIELPEETAEAEDEKSGFREGVLHALKFAGLFYHRQLMESDEATSAREYLGSRGYDQKIWKAFGLGYSPSGNLLLKEALREGIDEEYLAAADLVKRSQRDQNYFDSFRNRLMFPIFNPSGKVIAFAGRILEENSKSAKYINSSQTLVYNKSEVVYGVNFARNEIRREEEVILVEGYTDVISMNQQGVKNVVASSGTSLTGGQIQILQRYGSRLVMIYDSDSAGQNAMVRGLEVALAEGMSVELLELPEGEDPDSFIKKYGRDSFVEIKKKQSVDFVVYLLNAAVKSGRMEGPAERSSVIKKILGYIALIPNELDRQFYVQHLHQKTQVYRGGSDRELFQQLQLIINEEKRRNRYRRETARESESVGLPDNIKLNAREQLRPESEKKSSIPVKRPHYEMELIRLLLQYGEPMREFIGHHVGEDHFEDESIRILYSDIMQRHINGEEVSVQIYMRKESPFPELLGDILLEPYSVSEQLAKRTGGEFRKDKNPVLTAKSCMKPLRLNYCERRRREISIKLKNSEGDSRIKLMELLTKLQKEISRIQKTASDDLFSNPAWNREADVSGKKIFEYKMKEKNK
ncbi:MAG: DNA primase [Balneolaceae bacterium]|nr:MAG: DNA primase [Balneolaceae bacterium]